MRTEKIQTWQAEFRALLAVRYPGVLVSELAAADVNDLIREGVSPEDMAEQIGVLVAAERFVQDMGEMGHA